MPETVAIQVLAVATSGCDKRRMREQLQQAIACITNPEREDEGGLLKILSVSASTTSAPTVPRKPR